MDVDVAAIPPQQVRRVGHDTRVVVGLNAVAVVLRHLLVAVGWAAATIQSVTAVYTANSGFVVTELRNKPQVD